MNPLEMQTVLLGMTATNLIGLWICWRLWRQTRGRFAGTFYWVAGYACQAGAIALVLGRAGFSDWVFRLLPNTLILGGLLLGVLGLERFTGVKGRSLGKTFLLLVLIGVHLYFTYVLPSLRWRNVNLSLGVVLFSFQGAGLVFNRIPRDRRRSMTGVGVVFGLLALIGFFRLVFELTLPTHGEDPSLTASYTPWFLFSFQWLLVLLAYHLTLMVNQGLLQDLQRQEEKFRKAFASSPYAVMLTRLSDGQILEVNQGFVRLSGYQPEEALGRTTLDLGLWDREEDRALLIEPLTAGKTVEGLELRFRDRFGRLLIGKVWAQPLRIGEGDFLLASIEDITEQKAAEAALKESEERYRLVVQNANEAIVVAQGGKIVFHNPKALELTGYSSEELSSKNFSEFIHPEDRALVLERYEKRLRVKEAPATYPFRIVDKEGRIRWTEIHSAGIEWAGKPATLNLLTDITERRQLEERLQEISLKDELTGLYNRRGFFTLAEQQFKVEARRKRPMLLFFADLDGMKWINDHLGHQEGDRALQDAARILSRTFRNADILGRMGGDEFVVLVLDAAEVEPEALVRRLEDRIEAFNQKGATPYRLSLSIGWIAYDPERPLSLDQLLAEADQKMYQEKRKKSCQAGGESGQPG